MTKLEEALYKACLASAKQMGPDKLKQMSWFGANHGSKKVADPDGGKASRQET